MPVLRLLSRPKLLLLLLVGFALALVFRPPFSRRDRISGIVPPSNSAHRPTYEDDFDFNVPILAAPEKQSWRDPAAWLGPSKNTKPTILITGGAGQLGHALLPGLLDDYTVHVLDIVARPTSLPVSKNLVYHRGAVHAALPPLMETGFDGIIHLAGVSLDQWCASREDECRDVNVGAAQAVVDALHRQAQSSAKVPWVIFGGSTEVYGGSGSIDETSPRQPESALGRSFDAVEAIIEKTYSNTGTPFRTMLLRFSDIYGYNNVYGIPQALMNSLITNAFSSLPLMYSTDTPPHDFLHIDDALDAVLKVIHRMDSQAPGSHSSINIVHGGERVYEETLVEGIRAAIQSMSPLIDLGDHNMDHDPLDFSNARASELLSWQPLISLDVGISRSFQQLTRAVADYTLEYLWSNCPASPTYPPLDGPRAAFEEDERNKRLTKLDGCTVNMGFNNDGWMNFVKCDDGKHCDVNNFKVPSYNWNQSVFIVREIPGLTQERHVRVMFEQENGLGWLGVPKTAVRRGGDVRMELFDQHDPEATVIFDLDVQSDASNLRVLIPDSDHQLYLQGSPGPTAKGQMVLGTTEFGTYDMRMTVICCPSEGDWPLLLDDFETSDNRFGSTGQIPFNASRRHYLCGKAQQAVRHSQEQLAEVSRDAPQKTSVPTMVLPDRWAIKDLPPCWNDCDSPTICVQTGSCRCVQADNCERRRSNPLLTFYRPAALKEKPTISTLGKYKSLSKVLEDSVKSMNWQDVLLPAAKRYLDVHPEFPKIYVTDGYPGQEFVESRPCHKLAPKHCFSADNILYRAMRATQVTPEEADLIVVPVYHHCADAEWGFHDVMGWVYPQIAGIADGNKTIATVLTHDWGVCIQFSWEIWSARENKHLLPEWLLRNVLIWQVMGDWDSPCYRPHMDVVIPARSCQTYALQDAFGRLDQIRPMRDRPNLITWSGTYWGTGKNDRLRLTCNRGGAGERELTPGAGPQSNWESWDYMNDLQNARFCPQPRGIAGWSPRCNDAIYAGCIPVLTAEGSHYPFADFLDWSKFSVRVHPTEFDRIEDILAKIPLSAVEEMQANLVLVRDAFLYSGDERPEEELLRRGPMFFALHEAGMRMRTKYPVDVNWKSTREPGEPENAIY